MKKVYKYYVLTLLLVLLNIRIYSAAPSTYSYKNFKKMIQQFQDYSIVPTGGKFYTAKDYSRAYANINKSAYKRIRDDVKNFALSMNVSWESASDTPNTANAGCGLRFRSSSGSGALAAVLRMDGHLTFSASRYGKRISNTKYYYGRANIEATHNLTVVANGNNVKIYIDGKLYANVREVQVTRSGLISLITVSGTNKDWGTRCVFSKINYYVW